MSYPTADQVRMEQGVGGECFVHIMTVIGNAVYIQELRSRTLFL
jgi:hypothetical protein